MSRTFAMLRGHSLRRLMVHATVLLSVPVAVVVSGPATPVSAASTVDGPITRTEIIERADLWFRQGYIWDDTAVNPDPAGKTYRSDCSGYASMAWHLSSSLSSDTLRGVAMQITTAQLQPGDILVAQPAGDRETGHVAIFHRWDNQAAGTYLAYDHGAGPVRHQVFAMVRDGDPRTYIPYRYNRVLETPAGTFTGMSGANGTGNVIGTVNLPFFNGAVGVRAYVDGVAQPDRPSSTGTGNRSFTVPFTASLTASHGICVRAFNGESWTQIGTCVRTAQGLITTLGGADASGTITGVADVPGSTSPVQVRLYLNGVLLTTKTTAAGTGYRQYTATFTRSGTGAQTICAQANSYGYWHPTGNCLSTAVGTFTSMSGTVGSGNALGTVSAPGWSQGIQVRATVNGVAQPFRYSTPATNAYTTPFTVAAGSVNNRICVQANTYGYWTTLGCRTRNG